MKLIVNADDFGMSEGVNLGIMECFKNGIVTSTSMMMNMSGFGHALEIMKREKTLDVGIHFVLTVGEPLTDKAKIKSLLNEKGNFDYNIERLGVADKNELKLELRAQLNKFLSTGFIPSHIDFHHDINFSKNVLEVAIDIAKEHNLPMRAFEPGAIEKMNQAGVKHSNKLLYEFFGKELTVDNFINEVEKAKNEKLAELMCHPAYLDKHLLTKSGYNVQRDYELDVLTDEKVKYYIKNARIELIGFKEIK